jgi:PE-PPE domain
VSIGIAVVVMATVVPGSTASAATCPPEKTCSTALIMGTSGVPTPDDAYVENVKNRFIAPTHPGQIDYVKVTTPEGFWPLAGLGRLISLLGIGAQEIFGLGGPAWDVPWWKLSGFFDLTLDQSIQAGVGDLEDAMAAHPNESLVIFGYSQSAVIANRVKRKLAEQYPAGTDSPDIDFVLGGDPNLPNGGFLARFPGLYIPILDMSFNGPAPTDTQFDTVEITRQYDFMADFPLYPLNVISDLNALLGFLYVHTYPFDVTLAPDPSTSPPIQSQYGDTTYYFFETQDLPLFAPLRMLGVPEPVIDVVEPFFRVIVELGYDRSIPPWQPTPARLIPTLDPAKVTADLVNAIGEGITNAAALIGAPAPLSSPAPAVTADHGVAVQRDVSTPATTLQRVSGDVGEGVSGVLTALGSALPKPPAVTHEDRPAPQRTIAREPATTKDRLNAAIGTAKSVIGDGRTIVRSARSDNGSHATTARPARKTPVRDAVNSASGDITKALTKVSDSMKQALSGGADDSDRGGGEGGAR